MRYDQTLTTSDLGRRLAARDKTDAEICLDRYVLPCGFYLYVALPDFYADPCFNVIVVDSLGTTHANRHCPQDQGKLLSLLKRLRGRFAHGARKGRRA